METGHAKNVANFETAIIILNNLGAVYDTGQALILLPALQTKLTESKAVLTAVDTAGADKTITIDEREAEFKNLDKYAVNIKRTAEVEVNDEAFTKDLATQKQRRQKRQRHLWQCDGCPRRSSLQRRNRHHQTRQTNQNPTRSQIRQRQRGIPTNKRA